LGIYLIKQYGKIVIPLEYPPIRQIKNDDELNKLTNGLRNILAVVSGDKTSPSTMVPIFERQMVMSPTTGLFVPLKLLGDKISVGDSIGLLINPKNLKSTTVVAPFSGVIIEMADRQLYIFGEKLATIGRSV
jgi:predicted deacylase